ncbi:MAG: ribosome maturation factor [Actinobacteria bacterium HGW-Actinobacteria-10]|jgi:ribosome maturation factor RimP|nr:MAG: ribosome maturation factor [Actinobacteria bacterium HGW-Actinobacteria-10]
MKDSIVERVIALLEPVAAREGYELVAVEAAGAANTPILRVFLDREGGLDIDSLVAANAWISEALDASDVISSAYTLEVSSPGIDRPLRKLIDFERFAGDTVVLKTTPIEGRHKFTGTIQGVDGEAVVLESDGNTLHIPFGAITKAHLKGQVDFNTKGAEEDS